MQKCVGVLRQSDNNGIVLLDRPDQLLGRELFIPARHLNGAPFGMKVVCELLESVTEPVARTAKAKIIEVLGDPGRPDVAILSIIRQHGLAEEFPGPVLEKADAFPTDPDAEVIAKQIAAGRLDLRSEKIITIDGEDAKDLDDAIHIKELPDGNYHLGVHIADVTHYVSEDEVLDTEARQRGTSVYLVDRVIPMLPPRLSNGICSLNPGKDRLTLSVLLDIDRNGNFMKGRIRESVIRSQVRSSYNEVKAILETGDVPEDRPDWYQDALRKMRELADILRKKRIQRGTLEFEFPETHVDLDDEGKPVNIYPYPVSFANNIIEEFMIAANEYVAETAFKQRLPFLYRVHELPDEDKLQRFTNLARILGVRVKLRGAPSPVQLAKILEVVKIEPYGLTLAQLLLRSLAKARYTPENLGHFGLASQFYCHFTSPIRRYPDLFIHRVLKAWLHNQVRTKRWLGEVDSVAEHSSEMERTAMMAERDSIDQKAAEYMSQHIGDTFNGVISGFNQAGIYVQLESTVEGMIPFRSMNGYMVYDEERLRVMDTTGGHAYNLGDAVEVQVAQVDTVQRRIDFELLSHLERKVIQKNKINSSDSRKKNNRPGGKKQTRPGTNRKNSRKRNSGKKRKNKRNQR